MDQQLAQVSLTLKNASVEAIEATEISGSTAPASLASFTGAPVMDKSIDIGPFLRQEGRNPAWEAQHSVREEVIRRVRQGLGLHAEHEQRGQVSLRPSLWAALRNKIRQPG